MTHDGFKIEAFEAGRGLWHARIRRGYRHSRFPQLEVGFAWSNAEAAIADAKTRIDYLNRRSVMSEQKRKTG